MTKLVTKQGAKLVIEVISRPAQSAHMVTSPNLSAETAAEMKPERIGYRLKLIREAKEMKPAQMAEFLGIERTYWSRFEGGKRPITDAMAALLVERCEVTLDFIILGRWDRLSFSVAESLKSAESRLLESGNVQ